MHNGLEILLNNIDPDKTLLKAEKGANTALERFQSYQVSSIDQFREMVGKFVCEVQNSVFDTRLRFEDNVSIYKDMALGLMNQNYGGQGIINAYRNYTNGIGDIREILKSIALTIADQESSNWIRTQVFSFWNKLSPSEWDEVADCYINEFRYLYSPDLHMQNGLKLRMNLPEVLIKHPYLLYRYRYKNDFLT